MTFAEPVPFAEAFAKLAGRNIVPSAANSYQWRAVEVALRERAFFSSRVESARVLQSMRDYLGDYLGNTRMENGGLKSTGRAEFVADMRELAIREGLGKIDPATGRINPEIRESDLTDIRSIRRLQLIFDTQTEASQEYGYWLQGLDPDILNVYPAQRFIRVRPVLAPRPYHAANEGAIRRKDDVKFWLSMNRDFGVPWGPWGYGSGMGVEDVDRDEAEAAGLLKPGERVTPAARDFNDGLSAGVRDFDQDILAALRRSTGGTSAGGRLSPPQAAAVAVEWPDKFNSVEEAVERWKKDFGVTHVHAKTVNPKEWGKPMSEERQREHLQFVGKEFSRLVAKYPKLKGKLAIFYNTEKTRCRATMNGPTPQLVTQTMADGGVSEAGSKQFYQEHGWNFSSFREGRGREDCFRHELGHTISTPAFVSDWIVANEHRPKKWWKKNVSNYAATNTAEQIAESFAIFTRDDYIKGTLPAEIESLFENILL